MKQICTAGLLLCTCLSFAAVAATEVDRWSDIRKAVLPDRAIEDGSGVIQLQAPTRAFDAALVPITVKSLTPQTAERYISKVFLFVDMNPAPLAGIFSFAPNLGWDAFETRIRINEYTNVRAVAEMNTGELYMQTAYVKAAGGCSAPALSDLEAAMARMGRMKMTLSNTLVTGESNTVQVMVSHPNNSGMQFDQISRNYIPAHFVHKMGISYEGKEIVNIDTNFSLSENPSIRFSFVPNEYGELSAYAIDSKNNRYEKSWELNPGSQLLASDTRHKSDEPAVVAD